MLTLSFGFPDPFFMPALSMLQLENVSETIFLAYEQGLVQVI